jgi:hypothetical protein
MPGGERLSRRCKRQRWTLGAAALACALAAGCLENDTEALQESDERAASSESGTLVNDDDRDAHALPESADQVDHEDLTAVSEIESATSAYTTFEWQQGWAAVPMGSTSDRFCFLTAVQGRFKGGGESVQVYISGGSWWLGGSSQQEAVAARALCIPRNHRGQTLSVSKEYRWSQGAYATHMGSDSDRVCFLMYVTGRFEGGGEQVEAYRSGGSWWLGGTSYQKGVQAGARCVNTRYREGPYYWTQGQAPVLMSNANQWMCGLTKVAGRFNGGGERVNAFVSGSWRYLGGSSHQKGVSSAAYCL